MIDDGISRDPNDLTSVTERQIKRYDLDPSSGLINTSTWNPTSILDSHKEVLQKKG